MTSAGSVVVRDGTRTVVVAPPSSDPTLGRFSVDVLATLAQAQAARAVAGFLSTPSPWRPEWFRTDGGPAIELLRGRMGAWGRVRWGLRRTCARVAGARRRARTVWSRELHRELRRQAGDLRLPAQSRARFKNAARRALTWAPPLAPPQTVFPRRLLRERIAVTLSDAALAEANGLADAAGLRGAPMVAFEVPARVEVAAPAIAYLTGLGYVVVRIGDVSGGPLEWPGVIDVAGHGTPRPLLDLWVLLNARFLVCQSADLQHAGYLTNTPTLRCNARDPFAAYPVRADGLLLLARAVDLDSGRVLGLDERLSEDYFNQLRNIGHASGSADEVAAATREMHESLLPGSRDADGQIDFRARLTDAAAALAPAVPYVAEWGADRGFMGDGRLARVQVSGAVA